MFSTRGLFKQVPCPGKHDCTLPNCLFKHDSTTDISDDSSAAQIYDPTSVTLSESPRPAKRRRIDVSDVGIHNVFQYKPLTPNAGELSLTSSSNLSKHEPLTNGQATPPDRSEATTNDEKKNTTPSSHLDSRQPLGVLVHSDLSVAANLPPSVTRTISPPQSTRSHKNIPSPALKTKSAVKEPFVPRKIERDPVLYSKRHEILKNLHKQMETKITTLRREVKANQDWLPMSQELETLALDEEERAAKAASSADGYKNTLRDRLLFFKRVSGPEMKEFLIAWRSPTSVTLNPDPTKELKDISTGLGSIDKEITILKFLRTGLHQHTKHGYIVKAPSDAAILEAQKAQKYAGNVETCDRCSTRFQVFTERNAITGQLTTKGPCHYHWGRIPVSRGTATGLYSCCRAGPGADPCTISPTHVFKVSDPARLASVLQFQETPKKNKDDGKLRPPVTFDCEMSYTTNGMELIRLTAITWPDKRTLLDILVQPLGALLDLNTRFSGVCAETFTTAPKFLENGRLPTYEPGDPLQKVASPKAARDLLFDHLTPDTPLIGHAIENDLNTVRIIHPFVIDTVLLYPHPRGLPVRYKLRDLARIHLKWEIQTGGEEGHDSKEDSEATGDLVLVKVQERWERMRGEGWAWNEDGTLRPPAARRGGKVQDG